MHDAARNKNTPIVFLNGTLDVYRRFVCWMPPRSQHVHLREVVLTAGHTRKVRPGLYKQPWSSTCDLILVGDLMEACHVPNLGDQGIELMDAMQARKYNNAESVLEHSWFT